jgi:hypothetical protein
MLSKHPSKIFSYIGSKIKSKNFSIPPILLNNQTYYKDSDKVELFTSYFSSVFNHGSYLPSSYQAQTNSSAYGSDTLYSIKFDHFFIYEKLTKIKSAINTTPDKIPYILLKRCASPLASAVTQIFSYSMMTGTIPKIWKEAIVRPIHKKGCTDSVNNYRPIALTCSLSKIMERIVRDNLLFFFNSKHIIPDSQHGFSALKSVTTQLLDTLDDWTESIDNKQCIDVVYFDFAKAFDTVSHQLLLAKLHSAGIRGSLLSWIKEFLTSRTFSVKIGHSVSKPAPVISGVPQGSVLGPLLFIFYIHDIKHLANNSIVKLKFFADDLKAYIQHLNDSQSI